MYTSLFIGNNNFYYYKNFFVSSKNLMKPLQSFKQKITESVQNRVGELPSMSSVDFLIIHSLTPGGAVHFKGVPTIRFFRGCDLLVALALALLSRSWSRSLSSSYRHSGWCTLKVFSPISSSSDIIHAVTSFHTFFSDSSSRRPLRSNFCYKNYFLIISISLWFWFHKLCFLQLVAAEVLS